MIVTATEVKQRWGRQEKLFKEPIDNWILKTFIEPMLADLQAQGLVPKQQGAGMKLQTELEENSWADATHALTLRVDSKNIEFLRRLQLEILANANYVFTKLQKEAEMAAEVTNVGE